jgi:hypothetical protein
MLLKRCTHTANATGSFPLTVDTTAAVFLLEVVLKLGHQSVELADLQATSKHAQADMAGAYCILP